jgi:hypothetical protein
MWAHRLEPQPTRPGDAAKPRCGERTPDGSEKENGDERGGQQSEAASAERKRDGCDERSAEDRSQLLVCGRRQHLGTRRGNALATAHAYDHGQSPEWHVARKEGAHPKPHGRAERRSARNAALDQPERGRAGERSDREREHPDEKERPREPPRIRVERASLRPQHQRQGRCRGNDRERAEAAGEEGDWPTDHARVRRSAGTKENRCSSTRVLFSWSVSVSREEAIPKAAAA